MTKQLIILPRLTEKSYQAVTEGVYTFDVPVWANRQQIADLVEEKYDVDVVKVTIAKQTGKVKSFNRGRGRYPGQTKLADSKKAFVRLAKDQVIADFNQDVADTEPATNSPEEKQ